MLRKLYHRYQPTITVLALAALFLVTVQSWGVIAVTVDRAARVGEAAYLAYKWDRAADQLPEYKIWDAPDEVFTEQVPIEVWGITTNSRQLARWTLEIVPYFAREGIVPRAVYPKVAAYIPTSDERFHFQVAGQAVPCIGAYRINYRFVNPASPWSERSELGTIVHEIGHLQGIACMDPVDKMEASNQVATLEVLAAMANEGNHYATQALLADLRGMAMGHLRTELYHARLPWLYRLYARNVIYTTDEEHIAGDRGTRYWADKQDILYALIQAYSAQPYRWALDGAKREHFATRPLLLGPRCERWAIQVDDLAYFMKHFDRHVEIALSKGG